MKVKVSKLFSGRSAEQIWDLAADVESYPDFLPWCVATKVVKREGNRAKVDNVFGKGLVRVRFTSHADFDRPRGLVVRSTDGPFEEMELRWHFEETDAGCLATFEIEQHFRMALLDGLAEPMMRKIEETVIEGFEERAWAVYGDPSPSSST